MAYFCSGYTVFVRVYGVENGLLVLSGLFVLLNETTKKPKSHSDFKKIFLRE